MALPSPLPAAAPRSYRRMYGSGAGDRGDTQRYGRNENDENSNNRRTEGNQDEEGVEVVLDRNGSTSTKVVDSPSRRRQDQNVFRPPPHPHPGTHRPRPMRAPHGYSSMPKGISHGYGPPPPHQGEVNTVHIVHHQCRSLILNLDHLMKIIRHLRLNITARRSITLLPVEVINLKM